MLCSRREWLLVGVLVAAFRQTITQDIQQLVDNPSINAGSDVSLQVTAATADLAAGTWYILASPSPVRQLPNNDRTRYSVTGQFHRLTISNVVASDEGRYYYVYGQGLVTQGVVTVATQAAVSITGSLIDVTALEGSNSSMTTTVSTEGVTNGVWKRGTTVLTNAAGYTITTSGFTQTLVIQNVQTTQAGTYSYTVGGASTQATLTVVGRLGDVTGSVGSDVSFPVNVFPGNAGGSWSRNNVQIADSSKYQITQSSNGQSRRLLVRNVQTADAGAYVYSVNGQQSSGFLTVGAAFSPWTAWTNSACAVTCGTAVTRLTSRTRTCVAGSGQCNGATFESRLINCQLNPCPINGGVSFWGSWSQPTCTQICGVGATGPSIRTRTCSNPSPANGGLFCSSPLSETSMRPCNIPACPGDGNWGEWTQWSGPSCPASCGPTARHNAIRVRACNNPAPSNGGAPCSGESVERGDRACGPASCAAFSPWTAWTNSACAVTCGTAATRLTSRTRTCLAGSGQCNGATFESRLINCQLNPCPVNGGFSMWGFWQTSACPATCGTSATKLRTRSRLCSNPVPQFGGRNCTGPFAETQQINCNLTACQSVATLESNPQTYIGATISLQVSVPGPAQALGNWYKQSEGVFNVVTATARTVLSVDGTIHQLTLINVTAEDAGTYFYFVAGTNTQGDLTIMFPVHGGISQWSQWNNPPCPVTCGQGFRSLSRNRTCTQPVPQFGGRTCSETKEDTMRITCSLANCPIDGGYSPWSPWSNPPCSGPCGNLSKVVSRVRTCSNPPPQFGGRQCVGSPTQTATRSCNLAACTGCPEVTIYFVVDQSESVSTADFQLVKAALNSFVSSIISRNNNIRVGVIGFSSNVTSSIGATSDISSLQAAINFTLTPPNGGTSTHLGIRRATQNLNQDTSNYPKVMVVITDGLSNLPNETRVAAAEARNSGITVFAVGVLALNFPSIRQRFQAELLSIASSNATAIEIANFNVLTNSLNNISQILCRGTVNGNWGSWGPWSVTRCSGTCGTSIMGTSNRTRTCTNPAPSLNGNSCVGNSMEVLRRNCGFNRCPINGGWSLWTQWSTPQCAALCGSGVMATVIRQRACTNPSPSFGGNACQGSFQETELKTCGLSPCDGEVNGGFGQWNAWTVSPCSATCGRNVTRMLSRQRLCNNPAPANGGRDCIGPRNDTSNQLCSVPECQVTALCDDVKKQYGVGYRYHPTDCDKYIQCYDNPRGIAIGVYRSCPFGYYWNQDTFRCTESWRMDCPLERCKGSCGASYKMTGSCRSYWKCDDEKSVARCCPRGFSFSPGDGCYFNFYCDDECPSPYVSRDVCDKHPNWGNTNSYNISLGDLGWRSMSCPENSFFNILDCGCTQVSPATCAASYDFVAGTRPSWVQLEQVNNRVGALSLTNKSKVHLDIKMTVADSPIAFTFTYRETVVSNKSRVLASSKDRLVVSTEPKGVLFTMTSWYGEVTRMMLSTDGMPLNEWKTVSVMYTCKYLVGTVSNNNVKYMDRVLVKDTNILSDGLTIGSDASRVPGMPFVGDVGRVSVYKCDPGILV